MRKPNRFFLLAVVLLAAWSVPVSGAELVELKHVSVAETISSQQREDTLRAVRSFYSFWNTGDAALLKQAIDPRFTDQTLPPGRPQGPDGPAFASRNFRAAVPDLACSVEKVVVAGRFVTVHMHFTGHFNGRFGSTQGHGESVSFIATDLLEVDTGRIINNWHIEDNLTLFKQMGIHP